MPVLVKDGKPCGSGGGGGSAADGEGGRGGGGGGGGGPSAGALASPAPHMGGNPHGSSHHAGAGSVSHHAMSHVMGGATGGQGLQHCSYTRVTANQQSMQQQQQPQCVSGAYLPLQAGRAW